MHIALDRHVCPNLCRCTNIFIYVQTKPIAYYYSRLLNWSIDEFGTTQIKGNALCNGIAQHIQFAMCNVHALIYLLKLFRRAFRLIVKPNCFSRSRSTVIEMISNKRAIFNVFNKFTGIIITITSSAIENGTSTETRAVSRGTFTVIARTLTSESFNTGLQI